MYACLCLRVRFVGVCALFALVEMELGKMAEVRGRGGRSGSVGKGCLFPLRGQIYPAVSWSVPPICSGGPVSFLNLAVEPTRNTVRFSHTRDTIGRPDPTVLLWKMRESICSRLSILRYIWRRQRPRFYEGRPRRRDVCSGCCGRTFWRQPKPNQRSPRFFVVCSTQNTAIMRFVLVFWF